MLQIAQGETSPKTHPNDWKDYLGTSSSIAGFYIDIDTSNCNFATIPQYIVSMEGDGWQWHLNGLNCLYNVSKNGFRVYLRWTDEPSSNIPTGSTNEPNPLRISTANKKNWVLKWTGIHTCPCKKKEKE